MANPPHFPKLRLTLPTPAGKLPLPAPGPACRRHAGAWEDHESAPSRGKSRCGIRPRRQCPPPLRADGAGIPIVFRAETRPTTITAQQIHIGSFVRGTEVSNPVPSGGVSASRTDPAVAGREPRVSAPV